MILNNYFTDVQELAESSKEEVCGFLLRDGAGSLKAYPTQNVAPENRERSFEISNKEQLAFYKTGCVFAMYHSHVVDDHQFSELDLMTAKMAEIPMLLYSKVTKKFNYYRPPACLAPFEDRYFILGLQDCITLVSDYYEQKFGAPLPFFVRSNEEVRDGLAHLHLHFGDFNLIQVEGEPQAEDIILLSIMNDGGINHAGIYLGGGVVLHQMMHQASRRQQFDRSWLKRVRVTLRRNGNLPVKKFTSKDL
jgi:proteasome lid subunit RPN8/RPN11